MKLTEEEKNRLEEIYQSFFHNELIQRMKEVPMHRGSNCFLHSFKVAKKAVRHALHYKNVDVEAVLLASILHDYYLYDWRKDRTLLKHHGQRHPFIAAEHAKRDFDVNELVQTIIKSHMWPINFKCFPSTKEAMILSYSDKDVAVVEALSSKKHKAKKEKKYLEYLSKLF